MAAATPPRRILGVDPGTASTGFAIVEQAGSALTPVWFGCLTTTPAESVARRLARISAACADVIRQFEPQVAAIEELYFGASAKAALAVGQARGVCILACEHASVEVFEYAPASIKQAVTGYGRAEKEQVQRMVQVILGMREVPRPDHAADALAVAICHAGSMQLTGR